MSFMVIISVWTQYINSGILSLKKWKKKIEKNVYPYPGGTFII